MTAGDGGGPRRAELGALGHLLETVAGIMILAMMGVTAIDVVCRYFLARPIAGAFEITEILMGLVIFAGQSLAAARREHITVNLLEPLLSARLKLLQLAFGDLVAALVAAVIAWRVMERGLGLLRVGETTLQLGVPRGLVALAMAALMAAAAVVFLAAAAIAARQAVARRQA